MAYEIEDVMKRDEKKKPIVVNQKEDFLTKIHLSNDKSERPMNDLILREILKNRGDMNFVENLTSSILMMLFFAMIGFMCLSDYGFWACLLSYVVVFFITFFCADYVHQKNNLLVLAGFKFDEKLDNLKLFSFLKIAMNNNAMDKVESIANQEKLFQAFVEAMFEEKNRKTQLMHVANDITYSLQKGFIRIDNENNINQHNKKLNEFVSGLNQDELDKQFKSQLLYDTLKNVANK